MVATTTAYNESRNRAWSGEGYDGVVRVSVAGFYGTGVLLYDGHAVLTAAHLFANSASGASVHFETSAGSQTIAASRITPLASYDANGNNDLALVWLSTPAPRQAERYELYRADDEIAKAFAMVGYGVPGSGTSGTLDGYSGPPLRLKAGNQFDADVGTLKSHMGSSMSWAPTAGTQLVADFDDGTTTHDAFGRLIDHAGTGLAQDEGLISSGDSGGPAFIDGKVAGIASYTARLTRNGAEPDIDGQANSSFGEIAAWQRVSAYQQWVDQSMRAQYVAAPTRPEDVLKVVPEGNSGTSHAYFLVQFTGERTSANQTVSVDYATRDGTARAGEDYLAIGGTLILYGGENQAAIPVEIVGDTVAEPDETFYLDVTNPMGGNFGTGIVQLTAVRTIIDDDGGVWV